MMRSAFCAAALACALALLGSPARAEQAIVLVSEGQPKAVIVTPRPSSTNEQRMLSRARRTLVEHVKQMSGAELPVHVADEGAMWPQVELAHEGMNFVLLGADDLAGQLGIEAEGLGHGGMRLKTQGNVVALLGRADSNRATGGTAYAAVALLESLGVRYLWPGEAGKVVPKRETVVVPPLDVVHTPPLGQRGIRFMARGPRGFEQGAEALGMTVEEYEGTRSEAGRTEAHDGGWGAWNFLGGNLGIHFGHAGSGLRDAGRHLEENPEWFALQADGTRDQGGTARWRLCKSNPDLIAHVADDIIQRRNENPNLSLVSLCPNDGGYSSWCMCDACKALDPPDAPKVNILLFERAGQARRTTVQYPSLSDRMIHYWNAIAERVTQVHPDMLFGVFAYSVFATPPVREKLHPNLVVRYVPSGVEGWTGWQEAGAKRILWRPNILHNGFRESSLNRHIARRLAETMSYFAENGMMALDIQGIYHNWATMGMNYYVAARTSWDPGLTYDEILDDYCGKGFGPAAEHVKQYFLLAEELAGPPANYGGGAAERMRELLEAAREAARADEAVLRRIEFLRAGLEYSILTGEAYRLLDELGEGREVDREAAHELLNRRWLLMRRIAQREPWAVNTPLVAGNDAHIWSRRLGWRAPSEQARQAAEAEPPDDWLYEDQTVLPEGAQ